MARPATEAADPGAPEPGTPALPPRFATWFAGRGWTPRRHQLALVEVAKAGQSVLLIAPTGGGKTLAGFLPSLIALENRPPRRQRAKLHTHYISPLKALAADIARNLEAPVAEMGLSVKVELRTGDTSQSKRDRQRRTPPDILLTTPEQLALMLAHPSAAALFADLEAIILDELHAITESKRGDLLALDLARLGKLAPAARRVGLSATVAEPDLLRRYLVPQQAGQDRRARLVVGEAGAPAEVEVLAAAAPLPWSGHSARHALPEIYDAIRTARTALVFVNTRSQAEYLFRELWRINDDGLAIALHHGSLAAEQRRRVEAAMAAGTLRAVVCTATLDLGIDWGAVDLVLQIGAPKGSSRLLQRIGRANHRLDTPSRALLVPANRFEVLECAAARQAVHEGALDAPPKRSGALDVLAQHVLGMACSGPIDPDALYVEVISAAPYAGLDRDTFRRVVEFVEHGGYALRKYERHHRLKQDSAGLLRVANAMVARQYRLNAGTIVEAPMLKVRLVRGPISRNRTAHPAGGGLPLRGGRMLGEVEEMFIDQLVPGDTFQFAGETLRFEALREMEVLVSRSADPEPKVPSYDGGKFPLTTFLADRVRHLLADPGGWSALLAPVEEWLRIQRIRSVVPDPDSLLVETFPRGRKHYLVCYPFEGRLAHQTLGMLLTRRMERAGLHPLGFVASEYALAVWALGDLRAAHMDALFDQDMLGDDLEAWMAESSLLKRTFRTCAIIAGLIERRHPGLEKSGRQVTVSSDLVYDVLRRYEPDHILLQATWADAASGLLDVARLGAALRRVAGHIVHKPLDRISPLAVPSILEIGRESVHGAAEDALLREAADALIAEAMTLDDP